MGEVKTQLSSGRLSSALPLFAVSHGRCRRWSHLTVRRRPGLTTYLVEGNRPWPSVAQRHAPVRESLQQGILRGQQTLTTPCYKGREAKEDSQDCNPRLEQPVNNSRIWPLNQPNGDQAFTITHNSCGDETSTANSLAIHAGLQLG